MSNSDDEQSETELAQCPDVQALEGTIAGEQSPSRSLIESLLHARTEDADKNKRKKKIKTGRQQELERLTKVTKTDLTSPERLNVVCERIDSLLSSHRTILLPVCRSRDQLNSGRLSYEQFRLIIRDRMPGMSAEDCFMLTKLFEVDGVVDYRTMLNDNGGHAILRFVTAASVPQSTKDLSFNQPKQRYVTAHLRLLTFNTFDAYPGHVRLTVPDQITVYALSKMVIDETDLPARFISVFREATASRSTLLDPKRSLESYGYTGTDADGRRRQAFPGYTLYYDYSPLDAGRDCPILKCDYFMN